MDQLKRSTYEVTYKKTCIYGRSPLEKDPGMNEL